MKILKQLVHPPMLSSDPLKRPPAPPGSFEDAPSSTCQIYTNAFFFSQQTQKRFKKYRTVVSVVYFYVARTAQSSPLKSIRVFGPENIFKIRKMQIRGERPGVCYAVSPPYSPFACCFCFIFSWSGRTWQCEERQW